jgi:type II secretory pathway predicted ATPase ExeA
LYYKHFGLSGPPFEFAPTSTELFMSKQYREALFALESSIVLEASKFSLLVGESGTGKPLSSIFWPTQFCDTRMRST